MTNVKIEKPPPEVRHGFVAFFDIMGFKKMLETNEPEEINAVIRDVFHQIPGSVNYENMEMSNYGLDLGYLIVSDSIFVYQNNVFPGISDDTVAISFLQGCRQLAAKFLASGLPARCGISKGKFSIIEGKSFTGKCFVEAFELAEKLQLAACAITPAVEFGFLEDGINFKDSLKELLLYWPTPLKNSPNQKLMLLNYSHAFQKFKSISRINMIECFGMHKKDIGLWQ